MLALLKYNLLSLWVRRTTTLSTLGGIALVVFVLGASQMLSTGIRQTMSSAGSADQGLVLEHDAWTEASSRMDQAAVGLVAAAPGVKRNAAGEVMVTREAVSHLLLRSLADPARVSTVQVRGVSANVFELRPEARIIAGRIESGTIVAGGSDAPVERGEPMIEFYAAVARKDLKGKTGEGWHLEQRVSRENALKMFTLWAARAAFEEDVRGSIEVGKWADLTVLSDDIMRIPEPAILETRCVMTIVNGEIVHEAK